MDKQEALDKLRKAKAEGLANSCNIKVGIRELNIAISALKQLIEIENNTN